MSLIVIGCAWVSHMHGHLLFYSGGVSACVSYTCSASLSASPKMVDICWQTAICLCISFRSLVKWKCFSLAMYLHSCASGHQFLQWKSDNSNMGIFSAIEMAVGCQGAHGCNVSQVVLPLMLGCAIMAIYVWKIYPYIPLSETYILITIQFVTGYHLITYCSHFL